MWWNTLVILCTLAIVKTHFHDFFSKSYWRPMLLWMVSFLVALVMFGGLATQKCGPWEYIRMQNLGNLYTPTESDLHFHRMPKIMYTWAPEKCNCKVSGYAQGFLHPSLDDDDVLSPTFLYSPPFFTHPSTKSFTFLLRILDIIDRLQGLLLWLIISWVEPEWE